MKLRRWLVSLFHCCCLSSYFYFTIKYNYCSTVFISSCFYMVRKGGSFLLYLVTSMPKKIRCSSHIRRYRIAWWCKLPICNSFLLTQFPSDPSKNFQRIPAVRSKRVKAKRWLTEYTGFTLKRMARSSRLIVKVNCLLHWWTQTSLHCLLKLMRSYIPTDAFFKILISPQCSAKRVSNSENGFVFSDNAKR